MKVRRLIHHSFLVMGRYKLRTFFMMLGSLIGIAALTFVISVGQLAQRKILKMVGLVFSDSTIVIHAGGAEIMHGPRGAATRLTVADIQAIAKEVPGVADWDAQQSVSMSVRRGDATDNAQILGESERSQRVWSRTARVGFEHLQENHRSARRNNSGGEQLRPRCVVHRDIESDMSL
jgi:putative ABC transport system permease protein